MVEWEKQDRGWYTSHLGGIAEEAPRQWFFYPRDNELVHGPFKSMRDAAEKAELLIVPAHLNGDRA